MGQSLIDAERRDCILGSVPMALCEKLIRPDRANKGRASLASWKEGEIRWEAIDFYLMNMKLDRRRIKSM